MQRIKRLKKQQKVVELINERVQLPVLALRVSIIYIFLERHTLYITILLTVIVYHNITHCQKVIFQTLEKVAPHVKGAVNIRRKSSI